MTLHLLYQLTEQGWRVWSEWHPYFADHARGGWIEWLAARR